MTGIECNSTPIWSAWHCNSRNVNHYMKTDAVYRTYFMKRIKSLLFTVKREIMLKERKYLTWASSTLTKCTRRTFTIHVYCTVETSDFDKFHNFDVWHKNLEGLGKSKDLFKKRFSKYWAVSSIKRYLLSLLRDRNQCKEMEYFIRYRYPIRPIQRKKYIS